MPGALRRALLATLLAVAGPAAKADDSLYQATTFLTGQEEPGRSAGFAKALGFVLMKVTGDPRLATDSRVAAMAKDAAALVLDFHYRDLMEGIPVHDEQGTRQRPFDLTVRFKRAKVDAVIAALETTPWTGPRPKLVPFVGVRNGNAVYALAADGSGGRDQRDALLAAGERFGMPITLPDQAMLAEAGIAFDTVLNADIDRLGAVAIEDRKSTRLNSSHSDRSRMPSSA